MSFRDTLTSWGQVLPRTPPSDRKNKPAGKENSASGSRRQRFFDRAAATLGKSFTSPRGRRSPNTWKATVSEQPSDSSPTRKSIRKRLSTSFFQRNGPNSDELAETQERNACNKAGSVHAIEPSSEPLGVTGSDEPGDTDDAYQQLIAATTEGRIVSMPESMRPLLSCRDSRRDTPDSYLQLLIKSCESCTPMPAASMYDSASRLRTNENMDTITELLAGCKYDIRAHTPDPAEWEQVRYAAHNGMPTIVTREISPTLDFAADIDPDFKRRHAERAAKFMQLDLDLCSGPSLSRNDNTCNSGSCAHDPKPTPDQAKVFVPQRLAQNSNSISTSLHGTVDCPDQVLGRSLNLSDHSNSHTLRDDIWKANTDMIANAVQATVARMTRNYHSSKNHNYSSDEAISFTPGPSYLDFEKDEDDLWNTIRIGQIIADCDQEDCGQECLFPEASCSSNYASSIEEFDLENPFHDSLTTVEELKDGITKGSSSETGFEVYLLKNFRCDDLSLLTTDTILQSSILLRTPLEPFHFRQGSVQIQEPGVKRNDITKERRGSEEVDIEHVEDVNHEEHIEHMVRVQLDSSTDDDSLLPSCTGSQFSQHDLFHLMESSSSDDDITSRMPLADLVGLNESVGGRPGFPFSKFSGLVDAFQVYGIMPEPRASTLGVVSNVSPSSRHVGSASPEKFSPKREDRADERWTNDSEMYA